MLLYALHSVALLLLPRLNPALYGQVTTGIPRGLQRVCAWASILALGALVALSLGGDVRRMQEASFASRLRELDLTSLELLVVWAVLGAVLFRWSRRPQSP